MFQRSSLSVVAALAVGGALIAGCSSSSSSSSSAPSSAPAATTSAAATTAASSPAASADGVSAADCKIISGVSAGVVNELLPLQTESTTKAAASMKAYIATLQADQAKLTSPAGKAALASFIATLQKSLTETQSQATGPLTTAMGTLSTVCA
jgi:NitT/TauT family transport system substrate-binding protein